MVPRPDRVPACVFDRERPAGLWRVIARDGQLALPGRLFGGEFKLGFASDRGSHQACHPEPFDCHPLTARP